MKANILEELRDLARPIEWFRPQDRNARLHPESNLKAIMASLKQFGQCKNVVAVKDGMLVAGSGTYEAARRLGWEELAAVVFPDEATARAYALADNKTGDLSIWDEANLALDIRAEIERAGDELLRDIGFSNEEMARLTGASLVGSADEPGKDQKYTHKIVIPTYEPKGEKPDVAELVDTKKTDELLAEIGAAKLPPEVAVFLRHAAQRHTVFNFRKIADFYAHSGPDVQRLFEKSALVIIDFNQAVENGFVRLSRLIEDLIEQEKAGGDREDA